jgi:hypothetical protein
MISEHASRMLTTALVVTWQLVPVAVMVGLKRRRVAASIFVVLNANGWMPSIFVVLNADGWMPNLFVLRKLKTFSF